MPTKTKAVLEAQNTQHETTIKSLEYTIKRLQKRLFKQAEQNTALKRQLAHHSRDSDPRHKAAAACSAAAALARTDLWHSIATLATDSTGNATADD